MTVAGLQPREGCVQHVGRVHDLELAAHDVAHSPIGSLGQRLEHVAAQQHARNVASLPSRPPWPPSTTGKSCCDPARISSSTRLAESSGATVWKSVSMARLTGMPLKAVRICTMLAS